MAADGSVVAVPTHYEVLGIPEGASQEEVRRAYRRLVKTAHPDVAGDSAQFRLITHAYDVLSDPSRRALYDSSPRPAVLAAPPGRRPRYGRYAVLFLAASVVAGVVGLTVATARQSVGDDCLVGTWQGEAFEVPFRGFLDGKELSAAIRGGAGVLVAITPDGTVRTDYASAAPLLGADGPYRIEAFYGGMTVERWRAADGRVKQVGTDASGLGFRALINGRPPDLPVSLTVLDREYSYMCSLTRLELGPYRYTRT